MVDENKEIGIKIEHKQRKINSRDKDYGRGNKQRMTTRGGQQKERGQPMPAMLKTN